MSLLLEIQGLLGVRLRAAPKGPIIMAGSVFSSIWEGSPAPPEKTKQTFLGCPIQDLHGGGRLRIPFKLLSGSTCSYQPLASETLEYVPLLRFQILDLRCALIVHLSSHFLLSKHIFQPCTLERDDSDQAVPSTCAGSSTSSASLTSLASSAAGARRLSSASSLARACSPHAHVNHLHVFAFGSRASRALIQPSPLSNYSLRRTLPLNRSSHSDSVCGYVVVFGSLVVVLGGTGSVRFVSVLDLRK